MAPRTLPGLGLKAFFTLGENGWNDEFDENMRQASLLTQPIALSRTTNLPGSPVQGEIYIVPVGETNENEVAIRDDGAWVYYPPSEGWCFHVLDEDDKFIWDGTAWMTWADYTMRKGANVAAAATLTLGDGSFFRITGTATITDIDFALPKNGRRAWLYFESDGTTLTHNITTLQLPGLANIVTVAGDRAEIVQDSGDNIICLQYVRAAGTVDSGDVSSSRQIISGAGLTGGGDLSADRTLAVGAGTGIVANADDVAIDKASDANVRASASNKVLTADLVESASALVALTDGANIALDWDAGINFSLTIGGNRTLDNPTNGQPGTWRTVIITQDGTGTRTLAFGNQYKFPGGTEPVLTTAAASVDVLNILCVTSTNFYVFSALDMKQ